MAEIFNSMRKHDKERRAKHLDDAQQSQIPWTKHTEWHWSTTLNECRLDYWPSRTRFRYQGKTMVGDVEGFIRNKSMTTTTPSKIIYHAEGKGVMHQNVCTPDE